MPSCQLPILSIDPACEALKKVGGVFPFMYATRRAHIESYTVDATTKNVTAIVLIDGAEFIKITGRKNQNAGNYDLKPGSFGVNTWTHKVTDRVFHSTQLQRNAVQALTQADDLVFIVPTNARQVEIYGKDLGLAATSGKGGTGLALGDDTTALIEFSGDEPELPVLMVSTGSTPVDAFDRTLAALDALVV